MRWDRPASDTAFDLRADPGEWHGLAAGGNLEAHDPLARLRQILDRQSAECSAERERARSRRTGGQPEDPARREKLRALGYVD